MGGVSSHLFLWTPSIALERVITCKRCDITRTVHAMQQQHANLQRVLVTYATRGGSTRELAEQVAQVFEQSGVRVDLREVTTVTDIAAYHAVVLGSALYFQHLMPEARRFLSEN